MKNPVNKEIHPKVKFNSKRFFFIICRLLPFLVLTTLFLLPMGMESLTLGKFESPAKLIFPFSFPFCSYHELFFKYLSFTIYLIPFTALFLLVSFFISEKINHLLYILVYTALSIYIYSAAFSLMVFANTPRWFLNLPVKVYITLAAAFFLHLAMSIEIILSLRQQNPNYTEYKSLQKESSNKVKFSIKTKVTLTIIGTITAILMIFMILILKIYKKSYTEAVSSMGRAQAERAANLYVEAQGLNEKISASFGEQLLLNQYAATPFLRIDMITPVKKVRGSDGLYLEKIYDFLQNGKITKNINNEQAQITLEKDGELLTIPNFDEFSYTTATGKVKDIPSDEKMISASSALEYIKMYMNGSYTQSPIRDKKKGTCKYMYPVYFQRSEGRLLSGFTIVTYYEEVLMKSYFHAKILVFSCSLLFLYITVIISLLLADFIANPLLYLKTNVHKTSNTLSEILEGNSKISAENLIYTDPITSKDEIKEVSLEVQNMVNIMKGIIPYISFSTLQAAEKTNRKSTTSRELCFLFTDIRGFTTLCESKSPKEVVEILNHYLEIETEIILKNGGDIDKFVGDEMMAFFAGPKKEYNACKAAMEIRAAMRKEQEQAINDGSDYISMGIGINTGKVIFGSVGAKTRMDFTSIGDTVNLAARLEGANKAYGSKAIITEAVYEKLKDTFICRELDFITVKGKTEPVRIFEILQKKDQASDKLYEIKSLFEKGLTFYRKQQWEKAQNYFSTCVEKYKDMPSVVFIDRIEHFKTNPPPKKWDGVFIMKVK